MERSAQYYTQKNIWFCHIEKKNEENDVITSIYIKVQRKNLILILTNNNNTHTHTHSRLGSVRIEVREL